jgi:hypothetical protein
MVSILMNAFVSNESLRDWQEARPRKFVSTTCPVLNPQTDLD